MVAELVKESVGEFVAVKSFGEHAMEGRRGRGAGHGSFEQTADQVVDVVHVGIEARQANYILSEKEKEFSIRRATTTRSAAYRVSEACFGIGAPRTAYLIT